MSKIYYYVCMFLLKTVKVISTGGFPEERILGIQRSFNEHQNMMIYNVEGWAAVHTNLDEYLGWYIVAINSMPVSNTEEIENARDQIEVGEQVVFTLAKVHFKHKINYNRESNEFKQNFEIIF